LRKQVVWEGDSHDVIRTFPAAVRHDFGAGLRALQCGEHPHDFKPMKTIGAGAWELRARDVSGQFRAVYVALVKGEIHVLHCFQKKSQKTSRYDLEKAAARYRELVRRLKG
jgi:phage-related protein